MTHFRPEELQLWTGGRWSTTPTSPISAICHDTRSMEEGSLYVAIAGDNHDGHDFVDAAFAAGAAAAMISASFPATNAGPLLVVENTRDGLSRMAAGYRETLDAEIIGITGSVGKTSVKEMIASILSENALTARTRGNWNNDVGLPLSLLSAPSDAKYGVFEVGMNRPGEITALCDILRPSWGVITTIGAAHIGAFANEAAIAVEKASLLASLPRNGHAVVANDSRWFSVFKDTVSCSLVTVSTSRDADYVGLPDPSSPNGLVVEDRRHDIGFSCPLPLPGRYVKENALLAIAVGREHGVEPSVIATALSSYQPPPMRWEQTSIDGVAIVNDAYNANPVSMRAAIEAFADVPRDGERWLVLAGMLELGEQEEQAHLDLGRLAASRDITGLVVVGELGEIIADGAKDAGFPADKIFECATPAEAARLLSNRLTPHDAVLLKGSRGARLERVLEDWTALKTVNN